MNNQTMMTTYNGKLPIAKSMVSSYRVTYKSTTCRDNTKKWEAIVFAIDKREAEQNFLRYMSTKKHIVRCEIISIVYNGLITLDFGKFVMKPISAEQTLTFKKEPRHYIDCKVNLDGEWFIPGVVNLYRADIVYSTKKDNTKTKSIYGVNLDDTWFVDDVERYLSEYKHKFPTHMFKEHILNIEWVGEVSLLV